MSPPAAAADPEAGEAAAEGGRARDGIAGGTQQVAAGVLIH